jgi:hypothetical protein
MDFYIWQKTSVVVYHRQAGNPLSTYSEAQQQPKAEGLLGQRHEIRNRVFQHSVGESGHCASFVSSMWDDVGKIVKTRRPTFSRIYRHLSLQRFSRGRFKEERVSLFIPFCIRFCRSIFLIFDATLLVFVKTSPICGRSRLITQIPNWTTILVFWIRERSFS